jgi:DNA-binding PadR family transcriptional regulator
MMSNQQLSSDMLKGTLDMMILRTLATGDAHGHTIAKVIERTSEDVLEVEQGSLYPALHRLEIAGGSRPTGARVKTTARPSSTASPPPAVAASH